MKKDIKVTIEKVTKLQEGLVKFIEDSAPEVRKHLDSMMIRMSNSDAKIEEFDLNGEDVVMHHISGLQTLSNILFECSNDMELAVNILKAAGDEFKKYKGLDDLYEDGLDPLTRAMISDMDTDSVN